MKKVIVVLGMFLCFEGKAQIADTLGHGLSIDTSFIIPLGKIRTNKFEYRDTTYPNVFCDWSNKDTVFLYDHVQFMQHEAQKKVDYYYAKFNKAVKRSKKETGLLQKMSANTEIALIRFDLEYWTGKRDALAELR